MTKNKSLKYKFGINKRIQDFLDILNLDPENQYDLTNIPNLIYYFKDVEGYDFEIKRISDNQFHFSLKLQYNEYDKEMGRNMEKNFWFKKIYKNLHYLLIDLLKLRWIYHQEKLIRYGESKGILSKTEKIMLKNNLWYHMNYFIKQLDIPENEN